MNQALPGLRRIAPLSTADRVTNELRRSILSGALEPGRTFSLREVAGRLGVSFIPVREALRDLESEGLVVTHPGRSAMVAPLDLADLLAIFRLRRTLEPEIARRACLLLSDADLDHLERLAAGLGDESTGMDAVDDGHLAFHQALLAPATTAWDMRMLTVLWRAAERYIRIGLGRSGPDPDEGLRREQAHSALVAGFRQRDPDAVAREVDLHLSRHEKLALRALEL